MAFRKYKDLAEANERIKELEEALKIFKSKAGYQLSQALDHRLEVERFADNLSSRRWCKRVREQSRK